MTAPLLRRRSLMLPKKSGGGGGSLPPEYQQVAYIVSDGTAFIDTGVIGNHGIKIVARMGYSVGSNNALFGSRSSSSNRFMVVRYSNVIDFGYGSDRRSNVTPVIGTVYELTFDTTPSDGADFAVNGDAAGTSHIRSIINTNASMYIFGAHYTHAESVFSSAIFESMTITDASNNLLFDGVPCYLKNGGTIGIYDLANDVFLTNQAQSGSFTKGPDV